VHRFLLVRVRAADFADERWGATRVTGCVSEKIAQNVAQPIFRTKQYINFTVGRSRPNILAAFSNFQKTAPSMSIIAQ
jgi:hypothetical protein